jgi:hypothetical protein
MKSEINVYCHGFGLGVWRSTYTLNEELPTKLVAWTVALGPVTLYFTSRKPI